MTELRKTSIELSRVIEGAVPKPPESTNDYVARSPAVPAFWPGDKLVFLPRIQMVVIPVTNHRDGWDVVVVGALPGIGYKPGGHRLYVGNDELKSGTPISLTVTEVV